MGEKSYQILHWPFRHIYMKISSQKTDYQVLLQSIHPVF